MATLTQPLRVTFCAFDKPGNIGGPTSWLMWLMPALRERGFQVRCLVFLHTGEDGPMVEFLESMAIPYDKIHNPDTLQGSIRWILARLQQAPCDVFIPNVVTAANYACRWIRQAGVCTIGILHSDHGYCDALQQEFVAGARVWRMTGFVGVSRELERQLKTCATADTNIYRIPYGAPIPEARTPQPGETLRIGFFGRLITEQKRIQELTRIFCQTVRHAPGVEAVIYGDGPEKAKVQAILANEGAGLPVRLGGSIPPQQVQEEMRTCHVITLMSDYEGLPIALMEAMAGGSVPVCRFNKSGIPELIEDGVNGYIVNDDPEAYPAAIRRLRESPELWRAFSRASQQKILSEYTMDHGVNLWAECLQDQSERWLRPGALRSPAWITLPPANPLLNNVGHREQPVRDFLKRRLVRSRMLAGRIKQQVLNSSSKAG